jgi:hypothetical protein
MFASGERITKPFGLAKDQIVDRSPGVPEYESLGAATICGTFDQVAIQNRNLVRAHLSLAGGRPALQFDSMADIDRSARV